MRILFAIVITFLLLWSSAHGQTYQPYQPYAVCWQPVYVPGQYYAVPRPTLVGNWLFGPQVFFVPQPPQQPQR